MGVFRKVKEDKSFDIYFLAVLGIKPRALCVQFRCSSTKLPPPQPDMVFKAKVMRVT